jgi:hypothetical protein
MIYDRRWYWQYTLSYYGEAQLDRKVRKELSRTYEVFSITGLEQIESRDGLVRIPHLADCKHIKLVRVKRRGRNGRAGRIY